MHSFPGFTVTTNCFRQGGGHGEQGGGHGEHGGGHGGGQRGGHAGGQQGWGLPHFVLTYHLSLRSQRPPLQLISSTYFSNFRRLLGQTLTHGGGHGGGQGGGHGGGHGGGQGGGQGGGHGGGQQAS